MNTLCAWLIAHSSSCAELFGFICGVVNVYLATRENIWSWPFGVLNAAFYIVVFGKAGLYSDTGLQAVYLVLSFYGWWHWVRGNADHAPVVVTRTPARLAVTLGAVAAVSWFVLFSVTSRIPGNKQPLLDAGLTSLSLVAQWMMTRKLLENWLLWVALDVVYVGLFMSRGLRLTAVLYAVFLVLAISGHFEWKRSIDRRSLALS